MDGVTEDDGCVEEAGDAVSFAHYEGCYVCWYFACSGIIVIVTGMVMVIGIGIGIGIGNVIVWDNVDVDVDVDVDDLVFYTIINNDDWIRLLTLVIHLVSVGDGILDYGFEIDGSTFAGFQ